MSSPDFLFMHYSVSFGRRFRVLNAMDNCSSKALLNEASYPFRASAWWIPYRKSLPAFVSCTKSDLLYPAQRTDLECLHRAVQQDLSRGCSGRLPVRVHSSGNEKAYKWQIDYNAYHPHLWLFKGSAELTELREGLIVLSAV